MCFEDEVEIDKSKSESYADGSTEQISSDLDPLFKDAARLVVKKHLDQLPCCKEN